MDISCELYWSFRSPYSYLGIKDYRQIETDFDVAIKACPVLPLAVREPDFFKSVNPAWISYIIRDVVRVAQFKGLTLAMPSPDPIVQNMMTREVSPDQPYIYRLTRLGIIAANHGKGLAFMEAVSRLIWGGVNNWHEGSHLSDAARGLGLNLSEMDACIDVNTEQLDAQIEANQTGLNNSGHWGVPTLVINGEPFHGQDRIDLARWRLESLKS